MHELSLFAQVPAARHAQALNILAGLAAMQPSAIFTRHIVFQPHKAATDPSQISKKKASGPQQPQQLALIQLMTTLSRDDFGRDDDHCEGNPADTAMGGTETTDRQPSGTNESQWSTRIQEIPEPETKTIVLRKVIEESIPAQGIKQYLDDSKNIKFINEYFTEGHRFIRGDIILHLHRVLVAKPQPDTNAPRTTLPPLEELILLDGSGAFVLETTVRIEDRSKPTLVSAATEQLLALKNELKGSIDLRVPERLSMDTRVRDTQ
ncbi:hypothetical protein B9Z65_3302 [Elsinoe australis]|uniref:Mediator of RNA polymerase II transcription subunit 18 n=1 Tax=Elsinoe australis TaxID=40998 RepID=A0A2P7ZY19_9PEZI|nr:hypothetical protein B9Z65_3302 [Elsinoe australis]